jgi:N4-gp56 family major capsid protein
MNTTLNTAGTAYFNKQFYDKKLLETAKTRLVHATFGQKRSIPRHGGKRVEFRKYDLFTPDADALTLVEGVTPTGQSLTQSKVEAEVSQYGAYVEVSDLLDLTAYDEVLADSAELLGEQLGTVIEWVTRDAMCATTNVQYANGKSGRNDLLSTDVLTVDEIRKAVRTLKKNKARTFASAPDGSVRRPHYVCICSPDATYDLQNDALWQDVSKYSNAEQIYSGEIGRLFGVVFVEASNAPTLAAAGASSADLQQTIVFGEEAYGVVDINGSSAIHSIVKPKGSAGSADPLDQISTVGAKIDAFTVKILNDAWIVRIEHGFTA